MPDETLTKIRELLNQEAPTVTPMKMPDVTPAAIISVLTALLGAGAVLFKFDLTDAQRTAAVTLISTLVPVAFLVADAVIRHGRAKVAVARIEYATTPDAAPPSA